MSKLGKKLRKKKRGKPFKAVTTQSLLFYNSGKVLEAGVACEKELQSNPNHPTSLYVQGQLYKDKGQHKSALEFFVRAIDVKPNFAEAHFSLGCTYDDLGHFKEAKHCFKKALNLGLKNPFISVVMGNIYKKHGEIDTAINLYKKALEIDPKYYYAYFDLGNAYHAQRHIEKSIKCFKKALSINNEYFEALDNLGTIYDDLGNYEEAINCYNRSIKINNQNPVAHNNLANVFRNAGLLQEAKSSCMKAIMLNKNFAPAYKNLGTIHHEMGAETEVISNYRHSLELTPNLHTHSNLLYSMHYLENIYQKEIYSESLRWAEMYVPELIPDKQDNESDIPEKRLLNIGYLSPDFCDHSVSFFIEPVLRFHNREKCKVYCYANVKKSDAFTERIQDAADQWRDIWGMEDSAVVELIRRDNIDILVDLAGHTRGNRLPVFAQEPAPIQITWLGYPNTTGMPAIKYRLTDAIADPPGDSDRFHTEKLIRLPKGFLCYQPDISAPDVCSSPCLKKGYITFGSFNNMSKITDRVIQLWTDILHSVTDSRLILKSGVLADKKTRKRYMKMFTDAGINESRLDLLAMLPNREDHLGLYRKIDIGLDPFPYNGTTTTFEALWMGVPVVTLLGERHSGRVGASIMGHTGFEEFVAKSPEEYKTLAISLANDHNKLSKLRNGMREKLLKSSLFETQQFTENLEEVYRKLLSE